jgi:two-component system phosphate regulon response regulator PhoB
MAKENILVIDDEKDIVRIIQYHLKREGFRVLKAHSGGAALDIIDSVNNIGLIILDLMLPGINGLEICKRLKSNEKTKNIPVVMLTVKSEEADVIKGLKTGADDYITKPFSPGILVERVKTVLRRSERNAEDIIKAGELEIDVSKYKVKLREKTVNLTMIEFNILKLLAKEPGRVFSREELLKNAWNGDTSTTDKAVDVHITWLRQKLGSSGDIVETVRGAGYRLRDTE